MPRRARIVAPGVAHHVTQRGTDRQTVFFTQKDRRVYLGLLGQQSRLAEVRILAYCLMSNHIHLVAVPEEEVSLALCMQRVHGRYAQYLNARRQRCGHLWQNRYFSAPLDERHLWTALRYVERNPVRAGMVSAASEYRWSSAAAHMGGVDQSRVLDLGFWAEAGSQGRWRELIADKEDEDEIRRLRRATYACQPIGSEQFVAKWGRPIADTQITASNGK
jgi:putative transposase